MTVFHVPATVHGRVLVRDAPPEGGRSRLLLAFHGYAQRADDIVDGLAGTPGLDRWTVASIQALHPFYRRGDRIVASWMTREDRDLAIAENLAYVDEATLALQRERRADVLVCVGFSQGAAMAWRAGINGRHAADGIVALAGDIPPELHAETASFPRVLIGAGAKDGWYTPALVAQDEALLVSKGVTHRICRFDGGHEWTGTFRRELGAFLAEIAG